MAKRFLKTSGKNIHTSSNKGCSSEVELFNTIKEQWFRIIDNLSKVKMSVASFFSEGAPLRLENDTFTVSFPSHCSLHKEALQKKENKLLIEKSLSDLLRNKLQVKFILSPPDATEKKAEQKNNSDSFIHSAINTFNAHPI